MSETLLCPRCEVNHFTPYGVPHNEEAPRPALSRAADIYICNWCGINEALMDFAGEPLPLPNEWPVEAMPAIPSIL